MTLVNINNREEAEKALAERKANAPEQVNNASLPAGSPMYYYCRMCGHQTAVKPEGWFDSPPPKYCEFCTALREAGWVEQES